MSVMDLLYCIFTLNIYQSSHFYVIGILYFDESVILYQPLFKYIGCPMKIWMQYLFFYSTLLTYFLNCLTDVGSTVKIWNYFSILNMENNKIKTLYIFQKIYICI